MSFPGSRLGRIRADPKSQQGLEGTGEASGARGTRCQKRTEAGSTTETPAAPSSASTACDVARAGTSPS
jgi:hypothetical protein